MMAREETTAEVQAGHRGGQTEWWQWKVRSGQTLYPAGSAKRSDVGCGRKQESEQLHFRDSVPCRRIPGAGAELIPISSHVKKQIKRGKRAPQSQAPHQIRLVLFWFVSSPGLSEGDLWWLMIGTANLQVEGHKELPLLFSHSVMFYSTPWTAALQASLLSTISQSLFKFISIESMMPSNHLILCHPLH